MQVSLEGKRAVVTAGAAGIGLAIAQAMQSAGAEVLVSDIDEQALQEVPAGISASRVDVSDPSDVAGWLDPIAERGIDILVNNAGIAGPTGLVEDLEDEGWRRCLAVGLDSHFYCMRAVAPAMKRQKAGAVVNLASTAGFLGMPGRSPYTAVKYAVIGLTKTWAMELGPHGVRVNAIAPGSVNGDRMDRVISAHAAADGISEDQVRAMYSLGTSMATFVDASEIADMAVYLCSEKGKRISGQVIAVDGHTETLYPRQLIP